MEARERKTQNLCLYVCITEAQMDSKYLHPIIGFLQIPPSTCLHTHTRGHFFQVMKLQIFPKTLRMGCVWLYNSAHNYDKMLQRPARGSPS